MDSNFQRSIFLKNSASTCACSLVIVAVLVIEILPFFTRLTVCQHGPRKGRAQKSRNIACYYKRSFSKFGTVGAPIINTTSVAAPAGPRRIVRPLSPSSVIHPSVVATQRYVRLSYLFPSTLPTLPPSAPSASAVNHPPSPPSVNRPPPPLPAKTLRQYVRYPRRCAPKFRVKHLQVRLITRI